MNISQRSKLPGGPWFCWLVVASITLVITLSAGVGGSAAYGASAHQGRAAAPAQPSGVALARKIVHTREKPPVWNKPGPAFYVSRSLRGKLVYFIANGLNFPFVQNLLAGVRQVAHIFGMDVIAVDGAGSVAKAASLIQQGVGHRASIIVDEGFPSSQLSAPIRTAKAARIPFIEIGSGTPMFPPPSVQSMGVTAWATYCYSCAGKQMADFAVARSRGHVDGVVFNVPDISVSVKETTGVMSELQRLCPLTCKAKVVDAPLAQWSTVLPTLTQTSIQRDPHVNFLFPLFDSMVALMSPSVTRLRAQGRVRFVTYNATLPAMQQLKAGQLVAADIGSPQHWLGWGIMDQVLRILSGAGPVANENIPNRIFDSSNIQSVNLKGSEDSWYGVNYRKLYKKLWK